MKDLLKESGNYLRDQAKQRGHEKETLASGGLAGIGAMAGSFLGPGGAAIGAAVGGTIGFLVGKSLKDS